jgi:peptide/nickel transport system permease protein
MPELPISTQWGWEAQKEEGMTTFIVRRLLQSFVLLFFISALIYTILNLVPGGPFDMLSQSNPRITRSQIDRLNALLDLDKPLFPGQYCPKIGNSVEPCRFDQGRYLRWLGKVAHGDFGKSWTVQNGVQVLEIIKYRLGYTVLLMLVSTLLAVTLAIPIGIYSAVKQYSPADYGITAFAFFGQSMPTFWTGLLVMSFFAVALKVFPTGGVKSMGFSGDIVEATIRLITFGSAYPNLAGQEWKIIGDGLWHMALPAAVLVYFNMAGWIRFTRSSMLEVMRQDYMKTAQAKGLTENMAIIKHGLRNAMIPLITLLALAIPGLFSGAIITETIFSWPGMGRQLIDAINGADWPVVQAILIISAALVVLSNLLSDILYAAVDPRIKYS